MKDQKEIAGTDFIEHNNETYIKYDVYRTWMVNYDKDKEWYQKELKEFDNYKKKRDQDDGLKFFSMMVSISLVCLMISKSQYIIAFFPAVVATSLGYSLYKYTDILK